MSQEPRRVVVCGAAGRDFHNFNIAYHCGTPINLKGNGADQDGQLTITKVTELNSLFGKKPGSAGG